MLALAGYESSSSHGSLLTAACTRLLAARVVATIPAFVKDRWGPSKDKRTCCSV